MLDDEYPGRIMLAEANQWPEEVVHYFGSEEEPECHMCFHFPVMPRIFYSIRDQKAAPIVDIMADTPAIPRGGQWSTFLRNHDELTLEMVSTEERASMYGWYAPDSRMRANVGIRRRLAPLLDNSRKEIELAHALLLSLPGSPCLYYGDEIGMGDNIWLPDRDAVRTPMQWTPDRNAGFSTADPGKLYLPLVQSLVYHYGHTNVEAQLAQPTSLLHWVRGMLTVRRAHPALGMGDVEFLGLRQRVGARVPAVHRRRDRCSSWPTSPRPPGTPPSSCPSIAGRPLRDVFGGAQFGTHRRRRHGHLHARLARVLLARARGRPGARMTIAAQPATPLDEALLEVARGLAPAPPLVPGEGSGRDARRCPACSRSPTRSASCSSARGPARSTRSCRCRWSLGPGTGEVIGTLDGQDVRDGAARPGLPARLARRRGRPGHRRATRTRHGMITGEQSNTSVILGDTAILKVLRALQPGENPDVDVPRHLVDRAGRTSPRPLAWLEGEWADADGTTRRGYLGVLSTFVAGAEDGFELACAYAARGESVRRPGPRPGRRDGDHARGSRDGRSRRLDATDGPATRRGRHRAAVRLGHVRGPPARGATRPGVERVLAEVRALTSTPPRQRVHGDLHLGQVLRADGRWFITDFEGEPLAPLDERTKPDLAVRDLAGLLRSVDYAAAVGGLTGDAAAAGAPRRREALRAGYASSADESSDVLTRALELDKTLYEAVYESRNRPTWLPIPIAALDRLVG